GAGYVCRAGAVGWVVSGLMVLALNPANIASHILTVLNAIGCYYGGKLAHFGRDVHFLVRSDAATVRKSGLRIRGKTENIHVAKVNVHQTTAEIGPCDLVIVAVKTTSNPDLPALLPPLLHERTMLLTLQNGLGNEEFLAQRFGAERVLGGLCFICLSRIAPGVVERHDYGHVVIGEFDRFPQPRTHEISWEFKRCGVVSTVVENLALERWRKLVWNIPFNGLSLVAGGLDTAAILADDDLRLTTLALMDEVIAAANKCGVPLRTADALDQMKRTETMGAYKPSTLIDFENGKPLELEAIWGEPLRRASAAGAQMPRLEELYVSLRALDGRNRPGRKVSSP
ncbi:MAG: 2-dehydropantoate 2-reductase, partial [Verrucomicrobiota bacterium]